MSNRTVELIDETLAERRRQDEKWGTEFTGRDPNEWLLILLEEVGEAAVEGDPDALVEELIQVAASALSWAEHVPTQGRTNQFPDGAILRMETIVIGDKAKAFLETRQSAA